MNKKLCLVAIALIILLAAFPAAVSADVPGPLGGLNLEAYCSASGYSGVTLLKSPFGPNAAYDNWRCTTADGGVHPFSMEQACKDQYNIEQVQTHPTDPDSAYTWTCFSVGIPSAPVLLGGLNLDGYCYAIGYNVAILLNPHLGPNAAYNNWRCQASDGSVHPFSMEQACKWNYNIEQVQAHPTDPDDAYTWTCYSVQN